MNGIIDSKCSRCELVKPAAEFSKCSARWNKLQAYCRSCASSKYKNYSAENRADIAARMKKYISENKKAVTTQRKEYYIETRDQRIAYSQAWEEKNKERANARRAKYRIEAKDRIKESARKSKQKHRQTGIDYARHYRKTNGAKIRKFHANRRAAKLRAMVAWANMDAISKIYRQAHALSKIMKMKYEVDHIVPLRSKIVCGLHCEANLQVLTKIDNMKKGNRSWPDMP